MTSFSSERSPPVIPFMLMIAFNMLPLTALIIIIPTSPAYMEIVHGSKGFSGIVVSAMPVIRIFSWRNSGVWRSILFGLKRSDTIWKADNEIYLLTISDLGFRIEFWLFGEIFPNQHFPKPDLQSVCAFILGSSFSNSKA